MTTINIIVTCTKQKTMVAAPALQLRNLPSTSVPARVCAWKSRIDRCSGEACTARKLYSGDHWAVARSLEQLSGHRHKFKVWVISAGFGLLGLDQPISAYSATFSTRHPDSVVHPSHVTAAALASEDKRLWWNQLTEQEWRRERPISLRQLAAEFPESPLVLAASANYLKAVQDDLRSARNLLNAPQQLILFSAGTEELGDLTEHLVDCNARLQPLVGGILRSLNVRVLRHYLSTLGRRNVTLQDAQKMLKGWLDQAPERPKYDRESVTDDEVRSFVSSAFTTGKRVSRTGLLQQFRQSGRACEQNRFKALFSEVEAALHG